MCITMIILGIEKKSMKDNNHKQSLFLEKKRTRILYWGQFLSILITKYFLDISYVTRAPVYKKEDKKQF